MSSPGQAPARAIDLLDHLAAQIRRTIPRPDERHVHDLRVAIRRFRQALAMFKACLVTEETKGLANSLKQILSLAGEVRDCDIAAKLLKKIEERPPAAVGRLRRQRERILVAALKTWIQGDQLSHWQTQLKPSQHLNAEAARKLVRLGVKRAAQRVHKRAAEIDKSMRALHKLRIAAKKLRYALEFAGAATDSIAKLQTQLGDINDYRSARRLLKTIDGTAHLRRALAKKQKRKVRRFRREFKKSAG